MLGLPNSTEVNRRIAKEKIYANATLTPQVRDMVKDQIEAIFWRNKLANSTMSIASGKDVTEIQVFEIQLREREINGRVLNAIVKAIPYKILFVLVCNEEAQAWIEAAGMFYNTAWLPLAGLGLKFEGLNLDDMYENLARQIAGERLGTGGSIAEAVEQDKQRKKLERDIAVLEMKLLREKQFNRKVELNGELKRRKKELEELG